MAAHAAHRRLPFFLWLAEKSGIFAAVWHDPHQAGGWRLVPLNKCGAWYLLMLISFVLVSLVHRPQPPASN